MLKSSNYRENSRRYGINFAIILVVYLFMSNGCAFKLFEYPVDRNELEKAAEKTTDERVLGLVKSLENRSGYKLAPSKAPARTERLIRKDLQDFIDREWLEGRRYLENMDVNLYSSTIKDVDGLLVPDDLLETFDTGFSFDYQRNNTTGVKLSFVHLSDVQLRDERVYMFSKRLTEIGDYIADGFAHEPDMVFYDHSYYLTQIGLIRRFQELLPEDRKPAFMIHTGDSLHMGVVSELYEFIYMSNKLNIPWYNVLGNHDYQVYGNLDAKDVGVIKPNMGFQTVNSRHNFIHMHGKGFHVDTSVYYSPDNAPDDDTTFMTKSVYNGFDRRGDGYSLPGLLRERLNKPCVDCPGYYYFEIKEPKGNDPGILAVVLDTTTKDFRFAKGTVFRHNETTPPDPMRRLEQIKWLEKVLVEYSKKGDWIVIAFGHHSLNSKSFFDESYQTVVDLFNNPEYNVIAYFCGHSHGYRIRYHEPDNRQDYFGFWEIMTNSIMEYPKRGSLVNITVNDDGFWEISLQSFWPYFLDNLPDDAPALLENALKCYRGAMRDKTGKKKNGQFSEAGSQTP